MTAETEQGQHSELDRAIFIEDIIRPAVSDPLVIKAFEEVDHGAFIPEELRGRYAYTDSIVPLVEGSTISQPSLIAEMVEHLDLTGSEKGLEIGTGSGYTAAILSRRCREVYTIEYNQELANSAQERLARLGFQNVEVYCGDGLLGLPEKAPFDAIIVTGAVKTVPPSLIKQLKQGGRIVAPVGENPHDLDLVLGFKKEEFVPIVVGKVRFVPIVSNLDGGFTEEDFEEERSGVITVRSSHSRTRNN